MIDPLDLGVSLATLSYVGLEPRFSMSKHPISVHLAVTFQTLQHFRPVSSISFRSQYVGRGSSVRCTLSHDPSAFSHRKFSSRILSFLSHLIINPLPLSRIPRSRTSEYIPQSKHPHTVPRNLQAGSPQTREGLAQFELLSLQI